ncbi:MAG: hypothetical protein QOF67_743, partial [Mycobacterium sp.]|nr:hypothetical protein [Mycobacterium sp.]
MGGEEPEGLPAVAVLETLPAVANPGASTTFNTARFIGHHAFGSLVFHPSDASLCGTTGLTAVRIAGLLG